MITLDEYWEVGYREVQGWLGERVRLPIAQIAVLHETHAIAGGVLEIGVHHGRFFIALATLSRPGESCVAIDVFDQQDLNVDKSGEGNQIIFSDNVARYIAGDRKVIVIKSDSVSLNVMDRFNLVNESGAFRIISIDGGHTAEHVYSDMILAMDIMAGGRDNYC